MASLAAFWSSLTVTSETSTTIVDRSPVVCATCCRLPSSTSMGYSAGVATSSWSDPGVRGAVRLEGARGIRTR
eukprot:2869298-Pyramimonas_sp.AAC.1